MELIHDFPEHFQCIITSKRNIGKSFLARYLVYLLIKENPKRFSYIRVFSNTAHINGDWSFLPDEYVKKGFQDDVVQTILKFQEKKVVEGGQESAPSCLLIYDDVIGGRSDDMRYADSIDQIFTQGRHYKISSIFCMQYSKGIITPSMRSNTDVLFMGKSSSLSLEGFFEVVSSHPLFEKVADLRKAMKKLDVGIKPYIDDKGKTRYEAKFLYFNNTSHASPESQVRIIKAGKVPPSFRLKFPEKKGKKKTEKKEKKKGKEEEGAEKEDEFF